MSDHSALDRFLRTDSRDVGCEQALAVLHIYVDLVLDDPSGSDAALRYAVLAAHLLARGRCAEEFQGLPAAAGGTVVS